MEGDCPQPKNDQFELSILIKAPIFAAIRGTVPPSKNDSLRLVGNHRGPTNSRIDALTF